MVKFLSIIYNFYRRFLGISLLLNFLLYLLAFPITIAASFKLVLVILLYWSSAIAEKGKDLVFYHNMGWSSKKLFILAFLIDILLLLLIYKVLQLILW